MMSQEEYNEFEQLVMTNDRQTELACGNYLHHALSFLLPQTPIYVSAERENRNYFGSSDFVVSATLRNDRRDDEKYAFIWELKAPQAYLMEPDDNQNRCRPTADLIKAENQLLHYAAQAAGDEMFRRRFDIMHPQNIRPGGIIIGRRSDRMLRGAAADNGIVQARTSLQVRDQYFYQAYNIRVLTWDRILDVVRPSQPLQTGAH